MLFKTCIWYTGISLIGTQNLFKCFEFDPYRNSHFVYCAFSIRQIQNCHLQSDYSHIGPLVFLRRVTIDIPASTNKAIPPMIAHIVQFTFHVKCTRWKSILR